MPDLLKLVENEKHRRLFMFGAMIDDLVPQIRNRLWLVTWPNLHIYAYHWKFAFLIGNQIALKCMSTESQVNLQHFDVKIIKIGHLGTKLHGFEISEYSLT